MNIKTPNLTVDIIAMTIKDGNVNVILIERKNEPFGWALPGGFVDIGETLKNAALRELEEETNCVPQYINFLQMFDDPKRDPRGHNITAAFVAVFNPNDNNLKAKDDAKNLKLFKLDELPKLAFDHEEILNKCKAVLNL